MFKRIAVCALVVLGSRAPAYAQTPHVEVSGFAGWTFSDGVSADNAVVAGDGNIYDRVDPKDSASYGFSVGALVGPHNEVGFMFGQQMSKLVLGGTNDRELGDMTISTYHGYFGYNFGEADAHVRPFVFGGLGATSTGDVNATVLGQAHSISGSTKFSTTWGGGVKFFPNPRFAVRAAVRWTPTYVKSDAAGYWCDPYWGCYLASSAQYANQFEMSGGVSVRF
jgi:opacity protein-like surface antigen